MIALLGSDFLVKYKYCNSIISTSYLEWSRVVGLCLVTRTLLKFQF